MIDVEKMEENMQAYEFDTTVSNGFIKIPEEFMKKMPSDVRIIVLADERQKVQKKTLFPDFSIDTTGYTFNREEANER
jgi:predicted Zn-dependent protease with MMP-like domain